MDAWNLLSGSLLLVGSVFCVIGGIGLVRFPDFYARAHAAGVTDTFGAGFLLAGLMVQGGLSQVTLKLITVLVFMLVTGPTASHALAKAAFAQGIRFEEEHDDASP